MNNNMNKSYSELIIRIKNNILTSRYHAATLVNKELLILYLNIGKIISDKTKLEKWGSKVINHISDDLQKELPGLRGFSASNMKKMRVLHETWAKLFSIGSIPLNQSELTSETESTIGSMPLNQFMELFFRIGFSSHYLIVSKAKTIDERLFYMINITNNFWSVDTLKYHLKANLYSQKATLPTNFTKTIKQKELRAKALATFKDEYLLEYINIEDPDEEDEKLIENEIVRNIKKFIMSLGDDFSFIGNQYRVIVGGEDFYIDLLFYNRTLQSLVAIELKKGKFKAEYLGKMNLYLSALDEYVKKPYENPSIGIILCKEKNNKIVEFAFRDFDKAMGVATYKTSKVLPEKLKNILPKVSELKKIMDKK